MRRWPVTVDLAVVVAGIGCAMRLDHLEDERFVSTLDDIMAVCAIVFTLSLLEFARRK